MPGDPTGLRRFVFGNCDFDDWPPPGTPAGDEPWRSFVRAREALRSGSTREAQGLWQGIAALPDIESRQIIQAWHFLRAVGVAPPEHVAKRVYGAVAEVAVDAGHDLLAVYDDRSVRYLNHNGAAVVMDEPVPTIDVRAAELLEVGRSLATAIGPWEKPLPPLPAGHCRLTVLTPLGPHFGQGPDAALRADPMAGAFFEAATKTLLAVVAVAQRGH